MAAIEPLEYDIAEPNAPAMMQSLRAFGYDLATAIADILDNSITAHAKNVWVSFEWNDGNPEVTITDDGDGMSEEELKEAMRPSSRNPKEVRAEADLGRFGLGLKTASLSQCTKFTVYTKTEDSKTVSRCWDLDYIQDTKQWRLIKGTTEDVQNKAGALQTFGHGTIVCWQNIDRIFEAEKKDKILGHKDFLQKIDGAKQHLSMVFHRFLVGPEKINLFINDRGIDPWDPFLTAEKATQPLAEEKISYRNHIIKVQPYILPHKSRLSEEGHKTGGGIYGWNAHQGFYVYRNKRMLVAGSWLGLPYQKEEHYKLARVMIDIPNSMDEEWHLDVRKAQATPPAELRMDLLRIAKITRQKASDIYRHRGKVIQRQLSDPSTFVWAKKIKHGKVFYKINRDHPLIQEAFAAKEIRLSDLRMLLRLIEETIPSPYIVINNAESPDNFGAPFEGASDEVKEVAQRVFDSLIKSGLTKKEATERILSIEPFDRYPEIIEIVNPSA